MPASGSSLVIFVLFGVFAVAIVITMIYMLYDRVSGAVERLLARFPLHTVVDSLRSRRRRRTADEDEESEDLDDATASLLSLLDVASVVVDESDGVVRANPDAYAFGVVRDDAIVNDRVRHEIHEVREHGGRRQFDLTTDTPEQFVPIIAEGPGYARSQSDMQSVSRPNWLKVTVGRLNGRSVVVLLNDVSDEIRFSQTRDSFIVNVSEQLLAPSKELERLADTLEQEDLDIDRMHAQAERVRHSSRYMSHMVADLLLLIKAQEPVIPDRSNRISVREQLEWVADQLQEDSRRLHVPIVVACDDALQINGDAEQIRAAVGKLVSNALSYSPHGASVSLTATLAPDRQHVLIRVIDRGVGIDASEQPRVFERFYRGSNQNGNTQEGIGLGLAIVKHVALTHHGSVAVWSAAGQGSTFSMILPVAQE